MNTPPPSTPPEPQPLTEVAEQLALTGSQSAILASLGLAILILGLLLVIGGARR